MPKLRLAGLAAILTLALAGSASAASLNITLTPGTSSYGSQTPGKATITGSADVTSYLWVYGQEPGKPCAATVDAETNQGGVLLGPVTVSPGSFSQTASGVGGGVGRSLACGYLVVDPNDPHAPGVRYATPAATATSNTITSNPCTPSTISIESVKIAAKAAPGKWYSDATVTVHADGGGLFQLYDAATGDPMFGPESTPSEGGTVTWDPELSSRPIPNSYQGKPYTAQYAIDFTPESGNRCVQPDGTITSDNAPPRLKFSVTHNWHGGGTSDAAGSGAPSAGAGGPSDDAQPTSDSGTDGDAPATAGAPSQSLAAVLRKGAVNAGTVTYAQAGVLTADLLVGKKKAGEIIKVAAKGKPIALKFTLSAAGRAALKKAKGAKLTARLTFAPASGGKKQITSKPLKLKG